VWEVIGTLVAAIGTLLGGVGAVLLAVRKDSKGGKGEVKAPDKIIDPLRSASPGPVRFDDATRWVLYAAVGTCAVFVLAVVVLIDGATAGDPASATIWPRLATEIGGVLSLSAGVYGTMLASHEEDGGAARVRVKGIAEFGVLAIVTSLIATVGMAILG
jgi:hypothetical protein